MRHGVLFGYSYGQDIAWSGVQHGILRRAEDGLSYALARCFKILYPDLENPQTQHWGSAYQLFNLLL